MTYKGFFKPKNPSKYKGDPTCIIYRSSWELKLMDYLDRHPDIISWESEEFFIPYRSPIDNKIHRYFPDFKVVKKIEGSTRTETLVIEVKPKSQSVPPTMKKTKPDKKYIKEAVTYGINEAKWNAARAYCADRMWKFIVMTEDQLGIK